MKKILVILCFAINIMAVANTYYVAPSGGSDSNPGTKSQPWSTWQKAFSTAQPGDTVYFRGGVYQSTKTNSINPKKYGGGFGYSGTAENPICYFGYPGEWPVLDCINHCDTPGTTYNQGINISHAQFIHFKDFEVRNVFQCDNTISGAISAAYSANLTFEHIIVHNVGQRGYWIQSGAWGESEPNTVPKPDWAYDTTRFINCDVYDLCDTLSSNPGNAADGWKINTYKGNVYYWEGCRAWNYSDDGIDPSGEGIRSFNNCWVTSGNKYTAFGMEGNGIKATGLWGTYGWREPPTFPLVIVKNCIVAYSLGHGFYNNVQEDFFGNRGIYYNNTAYKCHIGFADLYSGDTATTTFKNNISYSSTAVTAGLPIPYDFFCSANVYTESNNTWDFSSGYPGFEPTDTVTVTDDDFKSLVVSQLIAPRKADGSLPDISFLHLAGSSDLIDAGTDVGLAYNGSAPDIGAIESDTEPVNGNKYPSVVIITPIAGNTFNNSEFINLKANAADPDGSVSQVEFFYESTLIGTVNTAPWSITWNKAPVGIHSLRAVATDNDGAKATSLRVNVTVVPGNIENTDNSILFPNPNNGIFTLFLADPLIRTSKVAVISVDGKTVYSGTILSEERVKEFDFSFLKPGTYLFMVASTEITFTKTFIKQ